MALVVLTTATAGAVAVIVEQGSDGWFYAVLHDPAVTGRMVPGARAATREDALEALQCSVDGLAATG